MAWFRVNRRDFINSAALAGLAIGAVKLSEGEAFAQAPRSGASGPDVAWLDGGKFEVDLAGTRLKAKVSLRCPFDPTGTHIKG